MTAPRRAILTAMLQLDTASDAVALLQAARLQHAATSIGTVYRLLRELEQLRLVHVQAQPHGRSRWRLQESSQTHARTPGNVHLMLQQVRRFLRELEIIGAIEALSTPRTTPAIGQDDHKPDAVTDLLCEIAERFGYRLA